MKVTTIGLDLARSVFQVHGVDDDGSVIVIKRLRRKQLKGFSRNCQLALSAWRLVPLPIIGLALWQPLFMRSD